MGFKVRLKNTDLVGIVITSMHETKLGAFYEVEFEDGCRKYIHVSELEEMK